MAVVVLRYAVHVNGLSDVLAFASGAGSLEALVLLMVAATKRTPQSDVERWSRSAADSAVVRHVFGIERTLAWLGHIGSRSLLTIGWSQGIVLPVAVAFVTFAGTADGVAEYLSDRGADRFDPATLSRYFKLASWLIPVELVALAVFLALLGG